MASQVIENITAINDEIRKTAAAATEQVRQTVSSAQEKFEQNLSQTQQAQSDLAKTLLKLNEQNAELASAAFTGFWDASLAALNIATWGQEQIERNVRQLVEQGRLTREEGSALLRDAAEQAQRRQAELYRLAQESVRTGLEGFAKASAAKAAK